MKAIVLLSGGLDSATCLGYAQTRGFDLYALSFEYGQRHQSEIEAAKRLATRFQVIQHEIIELSYLSKIKGSSLTNHDQPIRRSSGKTIPDTYVPARNTIFLTHAMAWAEIIQCQHIFIGASSIDYSGYPDCRPEYIEAFENLANLATKTGVNGNKINIHAPLLHLSKAQTIQLGTELGVDYSQTVSCYQADPLGHACGACDSCYLRQKGFIESKIPDPTIYQN